jgi:N-methylhydantoinase B
MAIDIVEVPEVPDVADLKRPESFWDGDQHSYIPSREVKYPASLRLHTEAATDIDPITYEVVRYGLWNANAEHVRVIENLAVSPIAVEIRDFQPCILTETAELLYFGPCLQYMSGSLDTMTRYVMENRGERVADGDMWLCNDPIVGTAHQPDVGLMCPVFIDDELFCWVSNMLHQNDIGGTVPGSFCPNAADTFWDPPSFPPFKIVEHNEIVADMESLYRRCSRTPENLSLDLRACVAGNHAARKRIIGLTEKYGKEVVKGVMRRVLDASQRAFEQVLDSIPDGVYSEKLIQEASMTGDRGTYPCQTTVTKVGRELVFDNHGTHDQVGAINVGYAGWRGAILGAINILMLPDQMGCVGGAVRLCRFEPDPGTITAPDWGAAISPAGLYATEVAVSLSNAVITKMMLASSDPHLRDGALVTDGAQWGAHFLAGTNQRGHYFVAGMGDNMLGAGAATWQRDGDFADGHFWIPEGRGPNIERYESDWPILYLFRREYVGSGGAGRFRSGNGGEIAYMSHRGDAFLGVYTTEAIPKTMGMLGGDPGAICKTRVLRNSTVRALFADGKFPQNLDDVGGVDEVLANKGVGMELSENDVVYWNWLSPSGYGDPMTREPALVAKDVHDGYVNADDADRIYGVVLAKDGSSDDAASSKLRTERFIKRLGVAGRRESSLESARTPVQGEESIGDVYLIDREAGAFACYRCGTSLGHLNGDPKEHMAVAERSVEELNPGWNPPSAYVDDEVIWRDLCCPGCGVRLATEVAYPGDPGFREFEMR